jgi:hypothetical protein
LHEIGRINGGKVLQNGGSMFRIDGNKFYDQKNEYPIKIPGENRYGIRIIVEFHEILTEFPNQEGQ